MTVNRVIGDLRVAVVGLGSIGNRHLQNLTRLGISQTVVVRRPEAANPAFEPPPGAKLVVGAPQAIAAGVDLAIICNPTSMHAGAAMEYLSAGVAVLIEKPLGNDLKLAQRLVTETERTGAWAGMAYCLRYHPAYRRARGALHLGRIGPIHYAKAWFEGYLPDWHPWEDYRESYAARAELGGGALPTLDHELDYLNWCLGRPESVSVCSGRSGGLRSDVDDMASVSLQYANGALASGLFSLCRRDRSRGFEFVGKEGTLRYAMQTSRLELVMDGTAETLWHEPDYNVNSMYLAMLEDALTAFAVGRPPPVEVRAGLDAMRCAGL